MHSLPIEMRGALPRAAGSQPEDFISSGLNLLKKSALVSAEEETSVAVRVGDVEYTCGYSRTTCVRAPVGAGKRGLKAMKSTYYSAAWSDSGCLFACGHEHATLTEAVTCIPCAGGYVVGIENGVMRSLSPKEESEFQAVIRDHSAKPAPHITVPAASAKQANRDSGYAVMTPIRVVDHWTWGTRMCFENYAQAVAHARTGDKVVRFASEEWAELKQQTWAKQPQQTDATPAIYMNTARETLPSRVDGEPLVEFVLRLLSALDPAGPVPIEGQKDDSSTSESDSQASTIETPTYMAHLILSRLSELEIGKLERMRETDLLALLKALRNRSQTVPKKRRYH